MRAGDDNGRMALLCREAQQTTGTTRFIVGMRMHHHQGMGFPGHRLLVCGPRTLAQVHARTDPPRQQWGGLRRRCGGRSHGGAQRLVAAHQARASTGDTLEPTILASWSTLPCCEARGVMRETWPTSASMTGRGGRRGLPGQELQRMHGGGPTRRMIENTAAGHHHRDEAQGAAVPGGRGAALPGAAGDGQSPPYGASAAGGLATS